MPIEPSIKIVNNPYIQSFLFKQYDDNEKDWIEVNKKSKLKKKEIKEGGFCKNIEEIVKIIEEEFENSQNPICIYFRGFKEEYEILKEVCKRYDKISLEEPQKYLPEINQTIEEIKNLFSEAKKIRDSLDTNSTEDKNKDNILWENLKKEIYSGERLNLYSKCRQIIDKIINELSKTRKGTIDILEKEASKQREEAIGISEQQTRKETVDVLEQQIRKEIIDTLKQQINKQNEETTDILEQQKRKEAVNILEQQISKQREQIMLLDEKAFINKKKRSIKEKFLDVAKDIPDFTKELLGIGYKKERNQISDKSISERIVDVVKDIPDFTKELLGIGYKKSTNSETIEPDMDEKKDNTPERNLEELKKSKEEWENKCRILEEEIEHLNSLIAKAQNLIEDLELA